MVCSVCTKGNGVFTCDGCKQSFCGKHVHEHRQDLARKLDELAQQSDSLTEDFQRQDSHLCLLPDIDEWEEAAIKTIRSSAQAVREDIKKYASQQKEQLQRSLRQVTDQLKIRQHEEDYTEIDLQEWTGQLDAIRKTLHQILVLSIEREGTKIAFRLGKLGKQQTITSTKNALARSKENRFDRERFELMSGKGTLTSGGLVIAGTRNNFRPYVVAEGHLQYASGVHRIHFLIRYQGPLDIFFGITTASRDVNKTVTTSSSSYGWWNWNLAEVGGCCPPDTGCNETFGTGSCLTLALDCDRREISLEQPETNHKVKHQVNVEMCPFPWRLMVELKARKDCVEIVHR